MLFVLIMQTWNASFAYITPYGDVSDLVCVSPMGDCRVLPMPPGRPDALERASIWN